MHLMLNDEAWKNWVDDRLLDLELRLQKQEHLSTIDKSYWQLKYECRETVEEKMKTKKLLRKLIRKGYVGPSPKKTEYVAPHKEIIIGIGNDETARLIMTDVAYELLMKDEK